MRTWRNFPQHWNSKASSGKDMQKKAIALNYGVCSHPELILRFSAKEIDVSFHRLLCSLFPSKIINDIGIVPRTHI